MELEEDWELGRAGCCLNEIDEEALANVNLVAQEWIETALELGRPVPNPKGRLMFA